MYCSADQEMERTDKQQSTASSTQQSSSGDYTTYTIKSGDSFYSIAKNYPGISAQDIMDFNGINNSKIRPGIYKFIINNTKYNLWKQNDPFFTQFQTLNRKKGSQNNPILIS